MDYSIERDIHKERDIPKEGDFSWIKDELTRVTLDDMYKSIKISEIDAVKYFNSKEKNISWGFCSDPELYEMVEHCQIGHSGSSICYSLRIMHLIFTEGWITFVNQLYQL